MGKAEVPMTVPPRFRPAEAEASPLRMPVEAEITQPGLAGLE